MSFSLHTRVTAIDRPDLLDDDRLKNSISRYEHREVVNEAITNFTMQHTKQEVMAIIAGASVPCGAVYSTYELLRERRLTIGRMSIRSGRRCTNR